MKLVWISPLLIIAITHFGSSSSSALSGRIYNGQVAELGQVPYQALLYLPTGLVTFVYCGGALISPGFVLTLAQCIVTDEIIVMVGMVDLAASDQSARFATTAQDTFIHPDFDKSTFANDIALVSLAEQYTGSGDAIGVIALPPRSGADPTVYDNQEGIVAGWGETNNSSGTTMNLLLLYAKVHVMPHEECKAAITQTEIGDGQLCTDGVIPSSPCKGDGGGALAMTVDGKTVVAGLSSFKIGGCSADYPAGYTNVAAYLDWISDITGMSV